MLVPRAEREAQPLPPDTWGMGAAQAAVLTRQGGESTRDPQPWDRRRPAEPPLLAYRSCWWGWRAMICRGGDGPWPPQPSCELPGIPG